MDVRAQTQLAIDAFGAQARIPGLAAPGATAPGAEVAEARTAGEKSVGDGFEELLARMLVSELRKSVPEGMFGGGSGSDVYSSWFDEHVSKILAEQRAFGIGDMVEETLGTISPEELAADDAEATQ